MNFDPEHELQSEPVGPRRRRRLTRKTFVVVACASLVVATLVASCLWLALQVTTAKAELSSASNLLPQLKDEVLRGDANSAGQTLKSLEEHTSRARSATSDPLWRLASAMPWVGPNLQAVTEVSISADDIIQHGAVPLVGVLESLDWSDVTPHEGGIDVKPLTKATPALQAAANAVQQSFDRLDQIDSRGLVPEVSKPLELSKTQLLSLSGGLRTAADIAAIAPDMLGSSQPRNYLLLVENSAEVRAGGGVPGALAVITIDKGKMTLSDQSSATQLGKFSPPISLDPVLQQIYSVRAGQFMQDVNLTPDFPSAAKTAQAMWERKYDKRVDGVVSIDPVSLSYILQATGPVRLTDTTVVSLAAASLPLELNSDNVVTTLLADVYKEISDPQLQDAYFAGVAKEIFGAVSTGAGEDKAFIEALAKGTEERRIKMWSASAPEQRVIERYEVSGSIAGQSVAPAEFGVYFNDGTGAKMDYYVRRSVQLVKECPKDGYEQTTVRVTSVNTASSDLISSLPIYVTGNGSAGVPIGSVQTNVIAYGPAQAQVETAKIDGDRTPFAPFLDGDRPVGVQAIQLAPGETKTIEFTFGKIVQHTEPSVVLTPSLLSVKDVTLPVQKAPCG